MPADIARLYPATGGVNQAILNPLKSAPLPNDFTTGDNLNIAGYRFNAPTPVRLGTHIARFDFNISPSQSLFVRGNYQNDKYGQAPQFPGTPSPDLWLHPKGLVAGHTWTIRNTMVNNARFGLTRQAFSQQGDSDQSLVNVRFVFQPYLYQRPTNRTTRDIMFLNNLRDPKSGQTWYEAAGILADLRDKDVPFNSPSIQRIPFFENFYPGNSILDVYAGYFGYDASEDLAGLNPSQLAYSLVAADYFGIADWTYIQDVLDTFSPVPGPYAFFQPQYGTLGVYSTMGQSGYNGGSVSVRQRLGNDLTFDFNYTYSKSFDYTSQLMGAFTFTTSNGLIRNPLNPKQARAISDFDITHNFNANYLIALPFGKGKKFLSDAPGVVNALLGGWQLSGVLRLNSGLPFDLYDIGQWATNWQTTSNVVRIKPVKAETNRNYNGEPNAFQDPVAVYKSFRSARAGEDGDRNIFRLPRYFCLDSALSKTFKMPYAEGHQLQFRWEVFNVTNTQPFGSIDSQGLPQDPWRGEPNPGFGRYISSQTPAGESRPGRVMQFALRYIF